MGPAELPLDSPFCLSGLARQTAKGPEGSRRSHILRWLLQRVLSKHEVLPICFLDGISTQKG